MSKEVKKKDPKPERKPPGKNLPEQEPSWTEQEQEKAKPYPIPKVPEEEQE